MNKVPVTKRGEQSLREELADLKGVQRPKVIEAKLSNVQVIDVAAMEPTGKVIFGATVHLMDVQNNKEIAYQIVGDDEADLKANRISYGSPVAKALIGKMEGDDVDVKTPKGVQEYEILKVEYI